MGGGGRGRVKGEQKRHLEWEENDLFGVFLLRMEKEVLFLQRTVTSGQTNLENSFFRRGEGKKVERVKKGVETYQTQKAMLYVGRKIEPKGTFFQTKQKKVRRGMRRGVIDPGMAPGRNMGVGIPRLTIQ